MSVDTDLERMEIKQWKKTAIKDFKAGKSFRSFVVKNIDDEISDDIRKQLEFVLDREDISKVFDIYLNGEYESVLKLKKLSNAIEQF